MFAQEGTRVDRVGKGKLTAWAAGAAHLIQTAAGARKAYDDSGNKHHKDGHANGDGGSEPAKEPM